MVLCLSLSTCSFFPEGSYDLFCFHWVNQSTANKNKFTASWNAFTAEMKREGKICRAAKNYVCHRRWAPKGGLRNANCQNEWFRLLRYWFSDSAPLLRVMIPLVNISTGIGPQVDVVFDWNNYLLCNLFNFSLSFQLIYLFIAIFDVKCANCTEAWFLNVLSLQSDGGCELIRA